MTTINDYLRDPNNREDKYDWIHKRVQCVDGFNVSVQANKYAYCKPRHDSADFYTQVELGFPSHPMPSIDKYRDDCGDGDPLETVYGYVPVELVDEILDSHGGIK